MNDYSEREKALIKFFGMGHLLDRDVEPSMVYTMMMEKAFIEKMQGVEVDSLRKCIKSLHDCKVYRGTPAWDAMIELESDWLSINAPDITVGGYYAMPDGNIAYVYENGKGKFSYSTCNGKEIIGHDDRPWSEFVGWSEKLDLKDFPNQFDPRLPYEFDLDYDLKRVSQLKWHLTHPNDSEYSNVDLADMREMAKAHNINWQ